MADPSVQAATLRGSTVMLALASLEAHDLLAVSSSTDVDQTMSDGSGEVVAVLAVLAVIVVAAMGRIIAIIRPALVLLAMLAAALALIVSLGAGLMSGDRATGTPDTTSTSTSSSIPPMGDFLPR